MEIEPEDKDMKYTKIRTLFKLPDGRIVRPINGETYKPRFKTTGNSLPDVSWSHGWTHIIDENNCISHCGTQWFEKNAEKVGRI